MGMAGGCQGTGVWLKDKCAIREADWCKDGETRDRGA